MLFCGEQICIPGIDSAGQVVPPGATGLPTEPADGVAADPVLGPNQILLWEAEPEPRQPSLLPEPPPWEWGEPSLMRRRLPPEEAIRGAATPPLSQLRLFA